MTNEHWLQLAIALISPLLTMTVVMIGFIYNNSRMNDLRQDLLARFSDLREEMKDLLKAEAARQDANLRRVEDMLLTKFAELDNRLVRIENHLNLR